MNTPSIFPNTVVRRVSQDAACGPYAFLETEMSMSERKRWPGAAPSTFFARRIAPAHVPIIFLTAKTMKEDILQGFRIGADDYISKPFNSEELLMRIQAVLKRVNKAADPRDEQREFNIGKFHFDYPLRMLTFNDIAPDEESKWKLSPKEADLLRLFCKYINDVTPRSEALNKIWHEDNYFTARSMDVFVTKLRKYLSLDPAVEIVNIHGNGFQLLVKNAAPS
jgi:DNA-binding response OmpR family regulator